MFSLGGSFIDTVDVFGGVFSAGLDPLFHGFSFGGGASYQKKEHNLVPLCNSIKWYI